METKGKQIYEAPKADIVEFETKDHIAASSESTGAGFTETIFD